MGWTILWLLALVTFARGELCLSSDQNPYLLFGTKTAYIFGNRNIATQFQNQDIRGCQPIAFWSLNRHGTHNPEAEEVVDLQRLVDLRRNILENYRQSNSRNIRERICSSDIDILDRWQWNPRHNLTWAGDLTTEGYMEMQRLAKAWSQRFPGLLTNNIHDYMIKYVNNERLKVTVKAFTEGIFGAQAGTLPIVKENAEQLLAPHKFCPGWINNIEKNNDTLQQKHIFESKREYTEMISNISQRLGFLRDLYPDLIRNMYQMCRYNKAWEVQQLSPWCAAFSKEDLRRLEYAEDLETYYKYGYGSPLNQKIGCNLVKDMMAFFTNHVEKEPPQQPRSMIYFSEYPTILMLLAAMGAHRDLAPLTGDNYHSQGVQSRKWSSSTMVPFSANVAAALYKCTSNGNFQYNDRYQVLFLENEKTMYLDGCKVGLCDWSYVKNRFGAIADSCNIDDCNSAGHTKGITALVLVLVAVAMSVL